MMSDDPLENSHWDDAISSNPGIFNKPLDFAAAAASAVATSSITKINNQFEENKQSHTITGETAIDVEEATQEQVDDDKEEEAKEEEEDSKHKEELLESLTKDADKAFHSSPSLSPNKNKSLFNDNNIKSPLSLNEDKESEEEAAMTTGLSSSATLSLSTLRKPVNVYRKGRYRRNGGKPVQSDINESDILSQSVPNMSTSLSSPSKSKADVDDDTDELGPLGQSLTEVDINTTTTTTDTSINKKATATVINADLLYQQATEQPLFQINRTNLQRTTNTNNEEDSLLNPPPPSSPSSSSPPPPSKPPQYKLQISVLDPIKVGDLTGAHILYTIRTVTDSPHFKANEIIVSRRYSDFRWLYHRLQYSHQGRIIPPPPEKQAVGRFNDQFIEHRRVSLERMLQKVAQREELAGDLDLRCFLQSERFHEEAKERELSIGDDSERAESSGSGSVQSGGAGASASNNNSGGFLSSFGGAFSFQVKYVEQDKWFIDKRQYIDSLESQLLKFSRSLEMIGQIRSDLVVVVDEFANVVMTLADLEVSKSITLLFQNFSNTQLKIKALLTRLTVQDILTLGSTLDEYQRNLTSAKKVFQQREKLGLDLIHVENELNKKKANLEKYNKYNSTQLEKINNLKLEVNKAQRKFDSVKERHETINKVIKEELALFEHEKIQDFRNSVEIYMEGLVEAQKENVELWQSFYDLNLA